MGIRKNKKITVETETKPEENLPMDGIKNPMEQKNISGDENLYETPPIEILDAAGTWFAKKEDFNNSKGNLAHAEKDLLDVMTRLEMTQVVVNNGLGEKKRIIRTMSHDKLKVSTVKE